MGIRCYEASSLMFGRSLVVDSAAGTAAATAVGLVAATEAAVRVVVEMGAAMGAATAVATAAAMAAGWVAVTAAATEVMEEGEMAEAALHSHQSMRLPVKPEPISKCRANIAVAL